MFFIIVLLIVVLIVIVIFAFRIKAVIQADNGDIIVKVFFLRIIKLQKKYVIKHEPDTLLKLYLVTKKGLKPVITLPEVVEKIKKTVATDIAFIDAITVFLQSLRKNQKKSAFNYIYKKIKYSLGIDIKLGIEDAFATAIACGFLNAISGAATAIYNNEKRLIRITVYPEFSKLMFWIKANCIIMLAPADIIIGYVIYKKNKNRR